MHSESTYKQYAQSAVGLIKRFEMAYSVSAFDELDEFFDWVGKRSADWSPSTIRNYRAALKWYFTRGRKRPFYEQRIERLSRKLSVENSRRRKRKDRGKAAHKAKGVSPQVMAELEAMYESKKESENFRWALALLKAGIVFGLRPIEWCDFHFDESDPNDLKMIVRNAKNSPERPNLEFRTLHIIKPELIETEINIARHIREEIMKNGWRDRDAWEKKVRSISASFSRLVSKGPRVLRRSRVTLYSARHQFAANAKKAGLLPVEIAALMGHMDVTTHQEHYGKRRKGYSGIKETWAIAADPKEVQYVLDHINKASMEKGHAPDLGLSFLDHS